MFLPCGSGGPSEPFPRPAKRGERAAALGLGPATVTACPTAFANSRPLAGKPIDSDMPSGIPEDFIPKQFNDVSTLEAEIPATGPHQLPFDLPAGR